MGNEMKRLSVFLMIAVFAGHVHAHFPWLTVSRNGQASYFFGDRLAGLTYKMPAGIVKSKIMMREGSKSAGVKMKAVEDDQFVGKRAIETIPASADLMSQATFGVYHGAKLKYYTQYLGGEMPTKFADCQPIKKMDLQAHAVNTDGGVDVYVLWKGKPLEGAEVSLYCDQGHEEGNSKTDADGRVSFNDEEVEDGIIGIAVGHTISDEAGKFGDQEYRSAMHYLTATFYDPEDK